LSPDLGGRRRPRPAGLVAIGLAGLGLLGVIASLSLDPGEEEEFEIEGAGAVQRLFGGIPQEEATLGDSGAGVTVQVFNDMQCTTCAEWQLDVIPPLVEGPVRGGEVKLEYHHFPITAVGLASFGAVAAGEQGRQWQFIQLFFINQGEVPDRGVTEEFLDRIAAAVLELDAEVWRDQLEDPEVADAIEADGRLAAERALPGEPTAVVDGPRGTRELVGSPTLAEIEAAVGAVG
jgi:protein-disulfide isomerase